MLFRPDCKVKDMLRELGRGWALMTSSDKVSWHEGLLHSF